MKKAIYALSADPIHYGHIDIIKRAAKEYDELIVGIGANPDKEYLFTLKERLDMARKAIAHIKNAKVVAFPGLLVDYAYEQIIPVVVKSVRNKADKEYEKMLEAAGETQKLGIKTRFLYANLDLAHISSTIVKALKTEQGFVHELVPLCVNQSLEARLLGQYIVGVSGEICAGKSYISKEFEKIGKEKGILVYNIELDHIPHKIYDGTLKEPRYAMVLRKLIDVFGKEIAFSDGTINRQALGEIVFNDPRQLEKLNAIIAKPLEVRLRREMYEKKGLILVNAALIAESNMGYLCNNNVVLVYVDKNSQERRLKTENLTPEQIKRRLASQYNFRQKEAQLKKIIERDNQGRILTIDNSDNSNPAQIASLFDEIIASIDIYGELRFKGLWDRIGADSVPDAEYKRLLETYSENHRIWHALPHIVSGINEHAEAKHLMENPDQVLFAWFYHDLVMKRKSRVDEERSAEAAYGVCKTALLSNDFAENIKKLVLTTKHHEVPDTPDGKFIADIDLSMFGKSPEEFDEYEEKIRKEYEWVDLKEFKEGRTAVLKKFFNMRPLYCTEFFRQKYEDRARKNLERSLAKLET